MRYSKKYWDRNCDLIRIIKADKFKKYSNKPTYITMYDNYPIYEAAEGGYYYEGRRVNTSWKCTHYNIAKGYLSFLVKKHAHKLSLSPHIIGDTAIFEEYLHYIGDGEFFMLEFKSGSNEKGWHPYE